MVFGAQSPADVLRSEIAHTILEQCASKIFLPNPHAQARDYIDGFCLSQREYQLVREEMSPERRQFLVPPSYVKPFVKRQKNDMADAEAICEAAQKPTTRFVIVKSAAPWSTAAEFAVGSAPKTSANRQSDSRISPTRASNRNDRTPPRPSNRSLSLREPEFLRGVKLWGLFHS
jgi:hypothetical protein